MDIPHYSDSLLFSKDDFSAAAVFGLTYGEYEWEKCFQFCEGARSNLPVLRFQRKIH